VSDDPRLVGPYKRTFEALWDSLGPGRNIVSR
jgi:hypothetical protein